MSLPIFSGEGTAVIKKEFANEFKEKVCEIFRFDGKNFSDWERLKNQIMLNDRGLLQFVNQTFEPPIQKFAEMVTEYADKIEEAQFWFTSNDDDGPRPEGFPFYYFIEVANGKAYTQTLLRRLPIEFEGWKDYDWFSNVYGAIREEREKMRREEEERRKNEPKTVKTKEVDLFGDDDLPF